MKNNQQLVGGFIFNTPKQSNFIFLMKEEENKYERKPRYQVKYFEEKKIKDELIDGKEGKIPIAAFIKDEKTVCVVFDHFIQKTQGNFKLKDMLED